MGWQCGWCLGEENVAFVLPLVDVMHVLGSGGRSLVTCGRCSRPPESGGGWPDGESRAAAGSWGERESWERLWEYGVGEMSHPFGRGVRISGQKAVRKGNNRL